MSDNNTTIGKVFLIILIFFAVACNQKNESMKGASIYNKSALQSFIISTHEIPEKNAMNCLDSILNKVSEDSLAFCKTVSYFETPFADPNSVYRNENLYRTLLQAKIQSPWYDNTTKTLAREKLYLLMQNRPGNVANDFAFITPAGDKKSMYDIHSNNTLLFFYNPECDACKNMKSALISSAVIKSKIRKGDLKIIAVYIDRDEKLWQDHLKDMPATWIQGRDEDEYLYKNKVYDLRAIPTVYLLDKEKKVLLKDCVDVSLIEQIILK